MKKIVQIIDNSNKKGMAAAYNSWAQQMLEDKLAVYHRKTFDTKFEVVAESEKAYKIRVCDLFGTGQNDNAYPNANWEFWMPKSAFVEA